LALDSISHVILPGVGAFQPAMEKLRTSGFAEKLHSLFESNQCNLLGICLGMQLMCETSHENGLHDGLGWFAAEVLPFRELSSELAVPHMGWNELVVKRTIHDLIEPSLGGKDVYFAHSYYVQPKSDHISVAQTHYEVDFCSIALCKNAIGMQFHPEKSQGVGLQLLDAFVNSRVGEFNNA
jgi:glutamine amidotransferase